MIPSADTDAELVARAIAGDRRAFSVLARRHGPRLARTVRALGVPAGDVEDVVQAALLATWRNLAEFDPGRSFLGWSSVIAANKARDWARHARTRRTWWMAAEPLDASEAQTAADATAGSGPTEDRILLGQVQAAVAGLPDTLRLPLVMVAVIGLTQTEAAEALRLSPKAVELRIARARRLLQDMLIR